MIVVFDTNAYLYLANNGTSENIRQRVDILKQAEAKYSEPIHALICDTVAEELLSHLCSPMSEDDKLRFGAAQAMYFHCGNKDNFGLLPQLWVQLAKELVDFDYTRLINNQVYIGQMLFQLSQLDSIDQMLNLNDEFHRNISSIYATIQDAECFLKELLQYIYNIWHKKDEKLSREERIENKKHLQDMINEESKLDSFIALVIANTLQGVLYKDCGILIALTEDMINSIVLSNKIPVEQFRMMLKGLKDKNANPNKGSRLNTIWDTLILFAAGKSINNEKILVITGDSKMITAANQVAAREERENHEVLSYIDYMRKIGADELIPEMLIRNQR